MAKHNRKKPLKPPPGYIINVEEENVATQNCNSWLTSQLRKLDFVYILAAVFVFMVCDIIKSFGCVEGAIMWCINYIGIDMHHYHIDAKCINYGLVGIIGLYLLYRLVVSLYKLIDAIPLTIGSHPWCMNQATERWLFENHAEALKKGGCFDWVLTKKDIQIIRDYYKESRTENGEDDTVDENQIKKLTSTATNDITWRGRRTTKVKQTKLGGQGTKNSTNSRALTNAAAQKNTDDKKGILMLVRNIDMVTLSTIIVTLMKFRVGVSTKKSDVPTEIRQYMAVGDRSRAEKFARDDRDAVTKYVKEKSRGGVDGDISSKDIQSKSHEQLAAMADRKYRRDRKEDERSLGLRKFCLMKNKDAMDNLSDLAFAGHLACIPVKLGKNKNAHLLFSVVSLCVFVFNAHII